MRTTLSLDEDVSIRLKAEVRRSGKPFKEVVNECLRLALATRRRERSTEPPFEVRPRDLGGPQRRSRSRPRGSHDRPFPSWKPESNAGGILRALLVEAQVTGPLVMDAFLAALALENGATLVTTDRDFSRFPKVRLADPTTV